TQFSKASGCGCKIAPAVLQEILKSDRRFSCEQLLVGYDHADDAAVYELENGQCLISTTDFFTPIVNDAFDFGRVAATNSISDVYAMGGQPIMALAILGWPVDKLGAALAQRILDGAREQCAKAGIPLAGGHSIDSSEPIFGLSVNGLVEKKRLKKNNTAEENDVLYLSKPIGSGVYSSAMKRGLLQADDEQELISNLTTLNSLGAELGRLPYVTAMTDVTGFGLAGHLLEMLNGTNFSAQVGKKSIPVFKNFDYYAKQFVYPDNTTRNLTAYNAEISGMNDLDFILFCDPQTSGGLLFTVKAANADEFEKAFAGRSVHRIGSVVKQQEKRIVIG
ncbi:MAG: selenide, water dikinase SelD, partial [Bacteroidia bacterium]